MSEPTTAFSDTDIGQRAPQYYNTVLQHFRTNSTAVTTVDELAEDLGDQQDETRRQVAIRLHHVTLPKLADAGLIDYDPPRNTARYRADDPGGR